MQQPMVVFNRRNILKNISTPMLNERKDDAAVQMTDAREIFKHVALHKDHMRFEQACRLFNDLSFVIVPFDKTRDEYVQLVNRLKYLLKNQSGSVKLFNLVEGMTRLNVDEGLTPIIREQIESGNFSRESYDIAICLAFFARLYTQHRHPQDLRVYQKLMKDTTHMQMHALRCQHLDPLTEGFEAGLDILKDDEAGRECLELLRLSMPPLIAAIDADLHRYKFRSVINTLQRFQRIFEKQAGRGVEVLTRDQLATVHRLASKYLSEYVSKSKKDINGGEFATLVDELRIAAEGGFIKLYEARLLERVVQVFLKDHAELYYFSTGDQLKLLRGFDRLIPLIEGSEHLGRNVKQALIQMTLNTVSQSDLDLYNLMVYYNEQGIIERNEYLLAELRQYIDARFDYMDRTMILKFCNLLKDLGMLFEDKDLMLKLQRHFEANYFLFELAELFQLMKLHAYTFYQTESFMRMMEDSVAVRIKDADQVKNLKVQHTLDFIEALSVSNRENRAMSSHLAKILRTTEHVHEHKDVPLFAVAYLSDFNLKISDKLHAKLLHGLESHFESYSLKELSHLGVNLLAHPNFKDNKCFIDRVRARARQELQDGQEPDQATTERLALIDESIKLEAEQTTRLLEDIEANTNLVELIEEDMLADRDVKKNQIVCDGRLKASFVVDDSFIIEIEEHNMLNFQKGEKLSHMSRARLADAIAKEHGFSGGYIGLSVLEMEYSRNEAEYLLNALRPLHAGLQQVKLN